MITYVCPRCGHVFKTSIDPKYINPAPTCAGQVPGRMQHIKPANMEIQDD